MAAKPLIRLPLHTAEDMLAKLKWEEQKLIDGWSVYDSYNFLVTAHHLYVDWILKGRAATPAQIARAQALPADAKEVFQAVIDVSNGSKHWKLDHPNALNRQIVEDVTDPICSGWDSFLNGDMVHFEFGGRFMSMSELSAFVMHYFDLIIYGTGTKTIAELSATLATIKAQSPVKGQQPPPAAV